MPRILGHSPARHALDYLEIGRVLGDARQCDQGFLVSEAKNDCLLRLTCATGLKPSH